MYLYALIPVEYSRTNLIWEKFHFKIEIYVLPYKYRYSRAENDYDKKRQWILFVRSSYFLLENGSIEKNKYYLHYQAMCERIR